MSYNAFLIGGPKELDGKLIAMSAEIPSNRIIVPSYNQESMLGFSDETKIEFDEYGRIKRRSDIFKKIVYYLHAEIKENINTYLHEDLHTEYEKYYGK